MNFKSSTIISSVLIFQISPPRMGSTWQFNTARELLLLQPTSLKSLYVDHEKECLDFEFKESENVLIKSHNLDPSWILQFTEDFEVKILLSLRNLIDTVGSARRVGIRESDLDILNVIGDSLKCIKDVSIGGVACHLSDIDQLNSDKELYQETISIREFLGLGAAEDEIARISLGLSKDSIRKFISNELKLGKAFSAYDHNTLWHGDHIAPKNEEVRQGLLGLQLVGQDAEMGPWVEVSKLETQVTNLKHFLSSYTQQRDELIQQRDELIQQRDELIQQRDELIQQRDELLNSTIWKSTKPIRRIVNFFKR